MVRKAKIALWVASIAVAMAMLAVLWFRYSPHRKPVSLKGAVIVQDPDSRERLPIADVEVSVSGDAVVAKVKSDSSGLFTILLPESVRRGRQVTLQFRHPAYEPLDLQESVSDKLYIAQMAPLGRKSSKTSNRPTTTIARVRVRYSIKAMSTVNIGSAAKPFQVVNTGNV